jgi:hypothetical protein
MKAAATGGRSVAHQDGLAGRRDGQPGRGAFVSNSRLLDIAAIGRRRSVGIGEGAKPARRPLHDRGCGPARAVESRCASAGERRGESSRDRPPSVVSPRWWAALAGGRGPRRGTGLLPGPWRIRVPLCHRRAGQRLLDQRGCLKEAPLAGQVGSPQPSPSSVVRPWWYPFSWSPAPVFWPDGLYAAGPAVWSAVGMAAAQAVRAARAAFTAVGARKAPSTSTEAIVARSVTADRA